MKKYFLHNGTESSGPFDLEELKAKRITKTSPVWFEGMENWKTAGEIPELKTIFVLVPPPFPDVLAVSQKPKSEKNSALSFLVIQSFLVQRSNPASIVSVNILSMLSYDYR